MKCGKCESENITIVSKTVDFRKANYKSVIILLFAMIASIVGLTIAIYSYFSIPFVAGNISEIAKQMADLQGNIKFGCILFGIGASISTIFGIAYKVGSYKTENEIIPVCKECGHIGVVNERTAPPIESNNKF